MTLPCDFRKSLCRIRTNETGENCYPYTTNHPSYVPGYDFFFFLIFYSNPTSFIESNGHQSKYPVCFSINETHYLRGDKLEITKAGWFFFPLLCKEREHVIIRVFFFISFYYTLYSISALVVRNMLFVCYRFINNGEIERYFSFVITNNGGMCYIPGVRTVICEKEEKIDAVNIRLLHCQIEWVIASEEGSEELIEALSRESRKGVSDILNKI